MCGVPSCRRACLRMFVPRKTRTPASRTSTKAPTPSTRLNTCSRRAPKNNGRVGQWGISYPGFYTTVGLLSRHPALKASSPQAPVTDWFWDDDHHNGAYFPGRA
ncbi:MAG: CocE/NonD family hydrolase [Hymenobacter sp.]